jgi:hypothetical protein
MKHRRGDEVATAPMTPPGAGSAVDDIGAEGCEEADFDSLLQQFL